jgi:DNA-binding response OmpR family regulator
MERNVITKWWEVVDITLKEWQVLGCLLNAEWSIVQRTTIIDEIWGDTGVWDEKSDAKLDVYIANLRKKLEKGLIETVKGVGYRLGG